MARRSQPPRRMPKSLTKMSQLSLPKCKWSRPLLTGTAPQTEFALTRSKQTTEKILTGARTHIRICKFWQLSAQNFGQLIQRDSDRFRTGQKFSSFRPVLSVFREGFAMHNRFSTRFHNHIQCDSLSWLTSGLYAFDGGAKVAVPMLRQ